MKAPGFSSARAKPFKEGPLTTVASVMVARSFMSPALTETVAAAAILSRMSLNDVGFGVSQSQLDHAGAAEVVCSLTLFQMTKSPNDGPEEISTEATGAEVLDAAALAFADFFRLFFVFFSFNESVIISSISLKACMWNSSINNCFLLVLSSVLPLEFPVKTLGLKPGEGFHARCTQKLLGTGLRAKVAVVKEESVFAAATSTAAAANLTFVESWEIPEESSFSQELKCWVDYPMFDLEKFIKGGFCAGKPLAFAGSQNAAWVFNL
nr:hypothetical protein BHM03_00039351 [Ipomoea batatas]